MTGWIFIVMLDEAADVHVLAAVTVNVYVPAGMPEKVAVVPLPESIVPVGERVTVHVPDDGSPLRGTLPVATEQVGCTGVPTTGADGVDGW